MDIKSGLPDTASINHTWGEPTSVIDWCEENYASTWLVAELWNTVSNIAFLTGGLIVLRESRKHRLDQIFSAIGALFVITGLASGLFHATLWWWGQKIDEIAETMMILALIYADMMRTQRNKTFRDNAVIYLIINSIFVALGIIYIPEAFCEIHLATIILFYGYRLLGTVKLYPALKPIALNAAVFVVLGFSMWCIDRLFCSHVAFLQLHAWWHVFTALSMYNATIVAFYAAVMTTGRKPALTYIHSIPFFPKVLSQSGPMA